MEQNKIKTLVTPIGMLLILTFITACSAPAPSPTLSPQSTNMQEPQVNETAASTETVTTPPVGAQSLCSNTYYPVRQGATWSYKSSGGPAGEYTFTDTITAVGEDSFTLSTQIGGVTTIQDWSCTPEGLIAHQLGGAPAAMLNSQGIQMTLHATNAKGVLFPSQINAGDQWGHTLDVTGHVSLANEEGEAAGNVQMDFSAVGIESVTVPAGTFEAMKIDVDTTLNVDVTYEGLTLPVSFAAAHTYWFAPGVGWVKATGTGTFLGTSFGEMVELHSYSIP